MIPIRNKALPMPGNGAKVATAPAATVPEVAPDLIGDGAPTPPPTPLPEDRPTLDAKAAPMQEPPRPKTAGRPGAPIQFSEVAIKTMITTLENCLTPKVTFSEDVNLMRTEAHRQREEGLRRVLAGLKNPA